MSKTVLVQEPEANWQKMRGEINAIKHINGYLSKRFIADEVPDDECLEEAYLVVGSNSLWGWDYTRDAIGRHIWTQFGMHHFHGMGPDEEPLWDVLNPIMDKCKEILDFHESNT